MPRICVQYLSGQCSFLVFLPYRYSIDSPQPAILKYLHGQQRDRSTEKVWVKSLHMKIGMGFILGGWKCSGIRPWWWLHNMMNILKTNEMYTLKWWIFMLYKLHLNFFGQKRCYNQCIWVPPTREALDTWPIRAWQHHSAWESLQFVKSSWHPFPSLLNGFVSVYPF